MPDIQTIPNTRDRIAEIIGRLVNASTLTAQGLHIVGWDVAYGSFVIKTNQGPVQLNGYAIILTARLSAEGGAVLLGQQTPYLAQLQIIPTTFPTEAEINKEFAACLENLQGAHKAQMKQGNNGQ